MTDAEYRILNRRTVAIHKETLTKVVIDNGAIPVENAPRFHIEQRDVALGLLAKKLGIGVEKRDCLFKHEIYEVNAG